MPRGIAKNGVRRPKGSRKMDAIKKAQQTSTPEGVVVETEAEILKRIDDRFEILDYLTKAAIKGDVRSLVVAGPAGLGKSYTVETNLSQSDPHGDTYRITKGYVRATGLFKLLYDYREENQILVFDDADSIFFDDNSLNFLKGALDTCETRILSYLAEGELLSDLDGSVLPKTFEYKGTVIFITNLDFDKMIDEGNKLAPHLSALVSRSHYIDLGMKSRKDYVIRIKQVCDQGMLRDQGLSVGEEKEVIDFIVNNQARMRELSLRMAIKLGQIRKMDGDWLKIAETTVLRNR